MAVLIPSNKAVGLNVLWSSVPVVVGVGVDEKESPLFFAPVGLVVGDAVGAKVEGSGDGEGADEISSPRSIPADARVVGDGVKAMVLRCGGADDASSSHKLPRVDVRVGDAVAVNTVGCGDDAGVDEVSLP